MSDCEKGECSNNSSCGNRCKRECEIVPSMKKILSEVKRALVSANSLMEAKAEQIKLINWQLAVQKGNIEADQRRCKIGHQGECDSTCQWFGCRKERNNCAGVPCDGECKSKGCKKQK